MQTTRSINIPACALAFVVALASQKAQAQETEAPDQSLAAEAEAAESGATMFPIPRYGGDLLTREALTGDWGGIRTTLAEENGIQFAVDVNQYYLGIWDGGRSRESDYNGSSDYRFKLDTGKAGLFPGGFLEVHGETYWGQSINGSTGAILPVNTDPVLALPAGPGTYLSHVTYTQFLAENFAVFFGKLDTTTGDSNRFAHGVGDRRFMNLGFSFNAVSLLTAPYSTLGAGFLFFPAEGVSLSFSAIDADGAIDQSGFDTAFSGNTTFSGELGIDTRLFEQPGRHTFGFLGSNKEYFSQLARISTSPAC